MLKKIQVDGSHTYQAIVPPVDMDPAFVCQQFLMNWTEKLDSNLDLYNRDTMKLKEAGQSVKSKQSKKRMLTFHHIPSTHKRAMNWMRKETTKLLMQTTDNGKTVQASSLSTIGLPTILHRLIPHFIMLLVSREIDAAIEKLNDKLMPPRASRHSNDQLQAYDVIIKLSKKEGFKFHFQNDTGEGVPLKVLSGLLGKILQNVYPNHTHAAGAIVENNDRKLQSISDVQDNEFHVDFDKSKQKTLINRKKHRQHAGCDSYAATTPTAI